MNPVDMMYVYGYVRYGPVNPVDMMYVYGYVRYSPVNPVDVMYVYGYVRYGPVNPVKHIKVQRSSEGMYFLVDCKMFRTIPVS